VDRGREISEDGVRRLLLAVGRPGGDAEILALVESTDAAALVAGAQHHHVVSLVHDRLRSIPGAPAHVLGALARPRLAAQAHRHLLQRTLVVAVDALEVPAIVMKGHVLADWYDEPLSRDFNDNDVLVRPADFTNAVAALESAGLRVTATNWHGFLEYEVGEVPMRRQTTVIDLHWHVVATGAVRRHFELPTGAFFERAVPGRVGDTDVLVLSPEDTLLHLCVNSGLGGGRRLRGLLDVDAVVRSGRVDLGTFAERARAAAVERLLAAGATVLVEKPLAADLDDARRLAALGDGTAGRVVVGYHLRCADTVIRLRDLVAAGVVGEPTSFAFAVGQHLEQWRPGTDPAASVTARRELGGGVLLELSHELDGVRFVVGDRLGAVASVGADLRTDGAPTDGFVDTVADLRLSSEHGVVGTVHLDMVSPTPNRRWEVTGPGGTVAADLLTGRITHEHDGATDVLVEAAEPGERDRAEDRLVDNLLAVHRGQATPVCTVADGVAALELVEAARRGAATDRHPPSDPTGAVVCE